MLTDNQLQELASECGITLPQSELSAEQFPSIETEKNLVLSLGELLSRDGTSVNFLAAGAYDFYRPLALKALGSDASCLSPFDCGVSFEDYLVLRREVELTLAQLVAMDSAEVLGECSSQVLADLLLELYNQQQDAGTKIRHKVLLPSTIPPALRLAIHTLLKYQSIETVVIGFDVSSGVVSRARLEDIETVDVLAIVLPYPNFFGALEEVAVIADWAHQNDIKTIVQSDVLSLTYLKAPAQLSKDIDFTLCDLQPLGFPLSRKNNAVTLLARSSALAAIRVKKSTGTFSMMNELLTIRTFFNCQSVDQLQQTYKLAHENLTGLIELLVQIPGIGLQFNSAMANECVIHFDGIDLQRALQILAGHNIIAGYPLGDEYPELENCLLIHCTDQHDQSKIDRLVQKMATVVKNLSTASCPVKPKFT